MSDIKNNKITFTIEDAKLINENPNSSFSIVSLDFFASGNNLHNLFISEDTLMKTANTIKNCPVVWLYDPVRDDATTHDDKEIACGFIPESAEITNRRLEDQRLMLTTTSYIWKKFSGRILEIFSRDGVKPISVEINVFDSKEREDGITELLDYKFEAVTILSSLVKPAIPLARATVLEFAKEYQEAVEREFFSKYKDLDFTILSPIKNNAKKSLELSKEHNIGLNSVTLSNARFLSKNEIATPEKIRNIHKFLNSNKNKNRDNKNIDRDYLNWIAHGGDESFIWSKELVENMDNLDNKNTSFFGEEITFPYTKRSEMPPSLRGVDPPLTPEQGSEIARQAEAIGTDGNKNGYAIAISAFKKLHIIKDGHWVEKEKMEMEFVSEDEIGKSEFLKVNKSKESLSNKSWGSVDKSKLVKDCFKASNWKSIIPDVFMKLEESWQDGKEGSCKYPVMCIESGELVYNAGGLSSALGYAKKQNESGVVSKVESIRKKMGLEESEENKKEEMSMADEKVKEEEKETPEEEKKELPEKEKEEEKSKEEKKEKPEEEKKEKMSLDSALDVKAILAFLEDETESYQEMATEFEKSAEEVDYAKVSKNLFCKMCKMAESIKKMSDENKTYMTENEELKKFKSDIEGKQFEFAVETILKKAEEIVPKEELAKLRDESSKYNNKNVENFVNFVKARMLDFSEKRTSVYGDINKIGLPFSTAKKEKSSSVWGV